MDNEAVEAMKEAVDIAPSIWESMESLVGDVVSVKFNLPDALMNAKVLTKRLSDNIRAMQESDPAADRKALRDDATVFAKVSFNRDLWLSLIWLAFTFHLSDGNFIVQRVQESWSRETVTARPASEHDTPYERDRGERDVTPRLVLLTVNPQTVFATD